MNLSSTFSMSFGDVWIDGSMSTSYAHVTGSNFQSFDGGRFIRWTMKMFSILSQGFVFERPKNLTIQIDSKTMTMMKMNDDLIPWKDIIISQANKHTIFGFTMKQWTIHVACLKSKTRILVE